MCYFQQLLKQMKESVVLQRGKRWFSMIQGLIAKEVLKKWGQVLAPKWAEVKH